MSTKASRAPFAAWILFLTAWCLSPLAQADPAFVNAADPQLPAVARGVPAGGALQVFGLELDQVGPTDLDLERFEVFDKQANLLVDNKYSVAPPTDAYFRGRVSALPDSIVVLAVPEKGPARGVITDTSGVWLLAGKSGHSAPGLENRKLDLETDLAGKPFECGAEKLNLDVADFMPSDQQGASATAALPANVTYTARVAVETDYEYYAKLGSVAAANQYMADLFAYASTVYEREINTNLIISWSRLWTGGAASDPWSATSGTSAALSEFLSYWNTSGDANIPADRTIAHMLSGKGLGGGIAYLSVLCNNSYGYGVSASLGGNFNINNPQMVWDLLVVTHEIGHNFGSHHTHCYNVPVDHCYGSEGGCYTGSTALPGVDSWTGGSAGTGNGTIMSYCHLLSGGYGNISFAFGQDHVYGVDAYRVPDTMKAFVQNAAQSHPSCLALVADGPLLTVTKSGNGGGTVTSDPAGIDCGSTCIAQFSDGQTVTLAAAANPGSTFTGWSGDCDANDSVTMDGVNDKTCDANFDSQCGNGILDDGEDCDGSKFAASVDCGGCIGTPTCATNCTVDYSACYSGTCDAGENCNNCPQDCISGTFGGAQCGNGICEAGDGEDCVSCPADCAGKTSGKPSGRFCCGGNEGCGNSACTSGGYQCIQDPTDNATPYCCGDGTCEGPEDASNCTLDGCAPFAYCGDGTCNGTETTCSCPSDCGPAPTTENSCTDNTDNDCDGATDCADTDCAGNDACTSSCELKGAYCSSNSECCSNSCNTRRNTCK